MRRILLALLIVFLSISSHQNSVKADESALVFSDEIIDVGSDNYLVPIKINNNPGIMGFKLKISYGDGVLVNSVSRGEVTKRGNILDNHVTFAEEKYFEVMWNNIKEINTNGILFIVGVTIDPKYHGEIRFDIVYSSPDTFNERYENVIFDCRNIIIRNSAEESTKEEQTTKKETIKDNAAETKTNEENVTAKEKTEELVKELETIKIVNVSEFKDDEIISSAKKDNDKGSMINEISDDKLYEAVTKQLQKNGIENMSDIPAEERQNFVEQVLDSLGVTEKEGMEADIEDTEDSEVNLFELIEQRVEEQKKITADDSGESKNNIVYDDNKKEDDGKDLNGNTNKSKYDKKTSSIVIPIIIILVALGTVGSIGIFVLKNRKD
ncbi:MAG: hypothetical protein K6G88_05135 [Lachnospiraceae bacterium]|nr:hypothetical protein [Lachnospiraceae bacterium]